MLEIMAGATGLEPATFGVTGQLVIQAIQPLFRPFVAPEQAFFDR
jgi:hypothetical protein